MTRPLLTALSILLIAGASWTAIALANPAGGSSETGEPQRSGQQHTFADSEHPTLTFLYTIGNQGYIEPCG